MIRLKFILFAGLVLVSTKLSAQEKTFVKEYTYKASEMDSKNSCRVIAINQLRSLLLNEIGVYVENENILKTSDVDGKFAQDFIENITTISAGITKLEPLEEKWDGETFWMKAKITIDPKSLEESLKELSKDRKKIKELEEIKLQLNNTTKELDQIKETLKSQSASANSKSVDELNEKYLTQIKTLSSTDFFLSGKEKYNNGDFTGAIEDYTKSIELNARHNQSFGGRGFANYRLRNYREAIADLNVAIEIYPQFADAYYSLRGVAKANLEDYKGSIEDFTKAYAMDPKFAEVVCNRATSKSLLTDYTAAMEDFNLAIKINPKYSSAYLRRGILQIKHLDQKEFGCLDLSKAEALGNAEAYFAIKNLCK